LELLIWKLQTNRYGSFVSTLQTQQSLKNNQDPQYPLTIADANNVHSAHCLDNIGDENHEGKTTNIKNQVTQKTRRIVRSHLQ
jgi:hypothetical protein